MVALLFYSSPLPSQCRLRLIFNRTFVILNSNLCHQFMSLNTDEQIRRCFSRSEDFNEIFDAFESAVAKGIRDIELYKVLFSNNSLTADEVRLFGEKLAVDFPELAYDAFFWLARVFEATQASSDNYELAFRYFQKAANADPAKPNSYLEASACYEQDLNIPPLAHLIDFVKSGVSHVPNPTMLYKKLADLHDLAGEPAVAEFYRQQAEHSSEHDDAAQ
jgi:tetratricopeptide (TPR) repeat protein